MKYKLTDDQFTDELKKFLNLGADDPVPVMPAEDDPNGINRTATLELVPFAEMPEEKKAELLAEAV
jgi:hypothetical protein